MRAAVSEKAIITGKISISDLSPSTVEVPSGEKCRRPTCNRRAVALGLCHSDYRYARSLIRGNAELEAQFFRYGKFAPRKRTAKDWFLDFVGSK